MAAIRPAVDGGGGGGETPRPRANAVGQHQAEGTRRLRGRLETRPHRLSQGLTSPNDRVASTQNGNTIPHRSGAEVPRHRAAEFRVGLSGPGPAASWPTARRISLAWRNSR